MSRANRQRVVSAVALVGFYLFAYQIGAFGGQIHGCNSCIRAAAFTYQPPALQIIGGMYQPAAALQQQAAAQLQMEASPDLAAFRDFQRFRQYEAWTAQQVTGNVDAASTPTEPPAQVAQPPAQAPAELPAQPPAAPPGAGPLPPPVPEGPGAWGARYPTLMAKCSKCHSGAEPDGGFILDGTGDIQGPHLAAKRDAIMREIVNNRMPRKAGTDECAPLSDEEMGAVIAELWLE